jgi:hypothetical protein
VIQLLLLVALANPVIKNGQLQIPSRDCTNPPISVSGDTDTGIAIEAGDVVICKDGEATAATSSELCFPWQVRPDAASFNTTNVSLGWNTPNTSCSPSAVTTAATNAWTRMLRQRCATADPSNSYRGFTYATAAAIATAPLYSTTATYKFWIGSGNTAPPASSRVFIGLNGETDFTLIEDLPEPSAYVNTAYIGCDAAEANFAACTNDNAGSATCTAFGTPANFPCQEVANIGYYIEIINTAGTSYVFNITRIDDPTKTASVTRSTDLPQTTARANMSWGHRNAVTANGEMDLSRTEWCMDPFAQ